MKPTNQEDKLAGARQAQIQSKLLGQFIGVDLSGTRIEQRSYAPQQ